MDDLRPLTDVRLRVTSSGRTPDGLLSLNINPLQSATDWMWKTRLLFPQRTGFCFSKLIFYQQHLLMLFVAAVGQRSSPEASVWK